MPRLLASFPAETIDKMLDSEAHAVLLRALLTSPSVAFIVYETFALSADEYGARSVVDPDRRRALFREHLREVFATGAGLRPHILMTRRDTPTPRKFRAVWEWQGEHGWHALFFASDRELPTAATLRWPVGAEPPVAPTRTPRKFMVVLARGDGARARHMAAEHAFVAAYAEQHDIPDLCYWCDAPTRGVLRCLRCREATYCSRSCRLADRPEHELECGQGFCCGDCRRAQRLIDP